MTIVALDVSNAADVAAALAHHHGLVFDPFVSVEEVAQAAAATHTAYVCLGCFSIGCSDDEDARRVHQRDFDLSCCGETVLP